MKCGMTFLHPDKNSATSRTNISTGRQSPLHRRAMAGPSRTGTKVDNLGRKMHRTVCRRRPQQFDRVFGRDRARRLIGLRAFHEMIRGRPIAVTIEQRSDDAAVQNSGKRFVFFLRLPFGHDVVASGKTADMQAIRIGWTATETGVSRRVLFLERDIVHDGGSSSLLLDANFRRQSRVELTSPGGAADPPISRAV